MFEGKWLICPTLHQAIEKLMDLTFHEKDRRHNSFPTPQFSPECLWNNDREWNLYGLPSRFSSVVKEFSGEKFLTYAPIVIYVGTVYIPTRGFQ